MNGAEMGPSGNIVSSSGTVFLACCYAVAQQEGEAK